MRAEKTTDAPSLLGLEETWPLLRALWSLGLEALRQGQSEGATARQIRARAVELGEDPPDPRSVPRCLSALEARGWVEAKRAGGRLAYRATVDEKTAAEEVFSFVFEEVIGDNRELAELLLRKLEHQRPPEAG